MKRTVPLCITALVGVILILYKFFPFVGNVADIAAIHFDILAAIAFILGGGNLLRTHGEKIYKQNRGWAYSVIAVVAFLATLGVGLFKVGVQPRPGFWTEPVMRSGQTIGLAQLDVSDRRYKFALAVRRAKADSTHDVFIDDERIGTLEIDKEGRGKLELKYQKPLGGTTSASSTQPTQSATGQVATPPDDDDEEDAAAAALLPTVRDGAQLRVGALFTGTLVGYAPITGEYNENGSAFWFMYQYGFRPLQQTVFAMLAFYVASAAFRAFRARNIESVLLLGTAFLILLGRTYVGTWLTAWLPADEGFGSFFYIPNLTVWFMQVFNTAGQRAIMIGIALGVASTSLKVLLGVDRSYLGSKKE